MKWKNQRQSNNIQDQRYDSKSGTRGSGRLRLLPQIVSFLLRNKYGRIVLGIGVISYFMGYNPVQLLSFLEPKQTQVEKKVVYDKVDDETAKFVSVVLAQNEDIWSKLFNEVGLKYREPKLVLFREYVSSACGRASKQTGPFYCSGDEKIYLDMSFFDELKNRHNAPGDFAQAYVISHEVGHHVQKLLGTLNKSHALKKQSSKTDANAVQVKVELQADCYAGIWSYYVKNVMEDGDIKEALDAASAIGDDTLQKEAYGYVVPDNFTHGTSHERMKWFAKGHKYGKLTACQTGI